MSDNIIKGANRVLEIGFGHGVRLKQYLDSGINVFGVDSSQIAVDKFRRENPEYSNRVFSEFDDIKEKFDVVYCDALFEHLDQPDVFLLKVNNCLVKNGIFILSFPVLTRKKIMKNMI